MRITALECLHADAGHFTLDDLDDKQIETFSGGWFRIAFASRPDEASLRHHHVIDTLKQRPAIRALAGNPLLLTIIAIMARHEQLPHSRVGLYEHALKVLCHNWCCESSPRWQDDSFQALNSVFSAFKTAGPLWPDPALSQRGLPSAPTEGTRFAAEKLGLVQQTTQRAYERLVEEVPLRLVWREGGGNKTTERSSEAPE